MLHLSSNRPAESAEGRPDLACVYTMHMARLNVYVPDELAEEAKRADLNISSLTQEAIKLSLRLRSTDDWLVTLKRPRRKVSHEAVLRALDASRADAPTRHG
jgi:post-segregation antitoxin (ccd killing protein)